MNFSNQKSRRKYIEIAIHVLAWTLIFNMHLLTFRNELDLTITDYLKTLIFPFFYAVIFYVNYFVFIPRFLFAKRLVVFFVANILLFTVCSIALEQSMPFGRGRMAMKPPRDIPARDLPPRAIRAPNPAGMILRSIFTFAMTAGVAVAIHTTTQWFHSENRRKDLEREHLKSELANLKNQLNPHFFFNTLNNIYSLIAQNQEKAQSAVLQLSKLMRYLLYDSNEKYVPLSKEIDFMHHYIDLMKLRVTSNVTVKYSFPKEVWGHQIAPLLFISLIENSFKHGISLTRASIIEMELVIDQNKQVTFTIRNTSFPKNDTDRSGSGIGLDNLRKRLVLLYPHKHSLSIEMSNEHYQTILRVQL